MNRIGALRLAMLLALVCCNCFAFSQGGTSNQGKEFWTAYMSHIENVGGQRGSKMSLYITSDVNTTGKVEIADNSFAPISFTVTAKQITIVDIPESAYIKNQGSFNKGLHITALKNIAVYAHIYAQSVSGATLLLPVNTLGKSYFSINYIQNSNSQDGMDNLNEGPSYSTFMIVATEDHTTVEITPSKTLLDGKQPDIPFQIVLNKGQVYEGMARSDLTNTRIRSIVSATGDCKKIAVFSGSTKIGIGCRQNNFSSDNLFQQVYPTSTWGKNYITVPLKNRNYDVYRVVVSDDNTVLKVNGAVINKTVFAPYNFYEFTSITPVVVSADKPVQVVQYAVTQGKTLNSDCIDDNSDVGDPEMIYLNPLEQTLDNVTLYSTDRYRISSQYINVVIKTSAVPSFKLDDEDFSASFSQVPDNAVYSYAQITVSSGTHNIRADGGFNAIAYGFGDRESYGYAAGASLKNLNQYLTLANPANNKTQDNGCAGVAYNVQLTLPFATTQIIWDFNNGTTPQTVSNPHATTAQRDGKTVYIYKYTTSVTFPKGDHNITATVLSPVADECGNDVKIDFDFNIAEYPEAKFKAVGDCLNVPVLFTDESDTKGSVLQTWHWDFGDGQESDQQNPKHTYAQAGTYTVKLSVVNENGCSSANVAVQQMHIHTKPTAKFILSGFKCAGSDITFNDKSIPGDEAIKHWIWDFGDGTTSDEQNPKHVFFKTGTHTIKLTVAGEKGCANDISQTVNIIPAAIAGFTLPDVCVDDDISEYIFKSTITANAQAGITYHWDFGDTHLLANQLNTSAEKNPVHKYTVAGVYAITLTVTSPNGCSTSKTKSFTVNGNQPKADFKIENQNGLCSGNGIIVRDLSTVDFGHITRIIVYYDFANNPNKYDVFDRTTMPANGKYYHDYGMITKDQVFTIKVEAFSGAICGNASALQTILIYANPVVNVSKINSICFSDAPAAINVDFNGFTGSGSFTGTGVSADGLFDPKVAGAGKHTITYNFKTTMGCDYIDTQEVNVLPDPTAYAGADMVQLEGEGVIMPATATGANLTYKWEPSTGLDHDNVKNPVVSATDDTNYKLTVTSAGGCTVSDEILVRVLKTPGVVNAFTPNGDGINDTWTIKNIETYPGNTVDVYNRYGEKVYSSVGYAKPWDGRYQGAVVPAGTYYYIINPKNGRKVIAGSVTVIR